MWTTKNEPADQQLLSYLDVMTKKKLPREYLDFLSSSDGGYGSIPIRPHNVTLFGTELVIDKITNLSPAIPDGLVQIGDGKFTSILLDLRQPTSFVSSIPSGSTDYRDLYLLADNFTNFLSLFETPNLYAIDNDLRNNLASILINCQLWTPDTIEFQRKFYEIGKYAPEFEGIGKIGNDFIGLNTHDGSVWQVPLLGTKHLAKKPIADSIKHAEILIASFVSWWNREKHRYYEIKNPDQSIERFKSGWAQLRPWLDDFERRLRKSKTKQSQSHGLRRYDLDDLEIDGRISGHDLTSWPMPSLSFVRVDFPTTPSATELSKVDDEHESESEDDYTLRAETVSARRIMEDVLIGLHSQRSNLAFLMLGTERSIQYYIGICLPSQNPDDEKEKQRSLSAVNSLLKSTHTASVDLTITSVSSEEIKEQISSNCKFAGIAVGTPGEIRTLSPQLKALGAGMQGHTFGVLTLAVPIPGPVVLSEIDKINNLKHALEENFDPEYKRKRKYQVETLQNYLSESQLGLEVGMWLTVPYFFAHDRAVFARLQSLIRALYVDEYTRPTSIKTHEVTDLKFHIERFGILQSKKQDEDFLAPSYWQYRLTTPLSSRRLSAYVHLPFSKQ